MAAEQWFALSGVVIGGGLSFAVSQWVERGRRQHEQSTRWMETKFNAYATYTTDVKRVARYARWLATTGPDVEGRIRSVEQAREDLQAAEQDRSSSFERVVLIGSDDVIQAGNRLNAAVWELEGPARLGETPEADVWRSRTNAWLESLSRFHSAAREDIAVPRAKRRARTSTSVIRADSSE
ncbi:hypothetical protein GCM10022223_00890 [Kineosporia mesophila]|uniref:Secreted protein n=1 Tax=Kineosporia mesophila TaxID=566012 RepID=A0ABP6YSM8_9ACTN|nr:hypothetical protein [Kineosporia mesophila]MCD5352221.1 hypothetical protein [Kineosporia mesophila]